MRRKQATELIDDVRCLVAQALAHPQHDRELARLLRAFCAQFERYHLPALTPCEGEAHSNAFIDNCMRCAPRWGWVGAVEVVR